MPESVQKLLTKYATFVVTVLGIIGGATGASFVAPDIEEQVKLQGQKIEYIQKDLSEIQVNQKETAEKVVTSEKSIISLDENVKQIIKGQEEIKQILRNR